MSHKYQSNITPVTNRMQEVWEHIYKKQNKLLHDTYVFLLPPSHFHKFNHKYKTRQNSKKNLHYINFSTFDERGVMKSEVGLLSRPQPTPPPSPSVQADQHNFDGVFPSKDIFQLAFSKQAIVSIWIKITWKKEV